MRAGSSLTSMGEVPTKLSPSAARLRDRLAARIHALEDALILEAHDGLALLDSEHHIKAPYDDDSFDRFSSSRLSSVGHQMGPGTLVLKDENTECLLGAVAADVRSLFTLHLDS